MFLREEKQKRTILGQQKQKLVPRSWLAAAPSLTLRWVLCAVASLLLLAWMRTAILAGGIAVVRSGVGYVEDGDEVLELQARQRLEQKNNWGNKNGDLFSEPKTSGLG